MVKQLLNMTLEEIILAVKGQLLGQEIRDASISSVSTDTRIIEKNSLFIALKGDNFNGNEFLSVAIEKGASACIIDEIILDSYEDLPCNVIKVENSQKALLELAAFYRNKLGIKVVGVTGSTGKTSTKDLISAALGNKFNVYKTKGNFNNHIGMPLSILNMQEDTQIAILEMGMSNLKEIELLASVARPDVGVITNIGITHIENLKSQDNIFKAKMEITEFFNNDSILVVNGDDRYLSSISNKPYTVIKVGLEGKNQIVASDIVSAEEGMKFIVNSNDEFMKFFIPLQGKHNVENSLLAIAVGRCFGLTLKEIQEGLYNIETTGMRLEVVKKGDITLINDCYNASPTSMKAALDVQQSMDAVRRIAIIGYMSELGNYSESSHLEVADYAKEKGIDMIITLENSGEFYSQSFGENCIVFNSVDDLIAAAINIIQPGDSVLVKASRSQKFEKIVKGILDNIN